MAMAISFVDVSLAAILFFLSIRHLWLNRNALVTTWPLLGMLPSFAVRMQRFLDYGTEILKKSGGTFVLLGPTSSTDCIMTADPMNVRHILNSNFANYPKGPEFREIFEPLGEGILSIDSDLWRLQRKMFQLWHARHRNFEAFIARTMRRRVVNDLIPVLDRAASEGIQIDLQETFKHTITFDNAIYLIFGLDPASHSFKCSKAEYQKAFDDVQEAVYRRHVVPYWKLQRWLRIGSERTVTHAQPIFDEFMYRCIELKREQLARKNPKNGPEKGEEEEEEEEASFDMMTVYLEEKEKPYSDKFLKDVALNFVAAARDTLTAGLTWFFWLVATHPSVEAKILEELEANSTSTCPDQGGGTSTIDEAVLSKLVYLQGAIYETFRLYPSVPINHKTASEEDVLPSGHRVRKKQRVLMSFYAMGRMEDIWGRDCLEFKPERWISEQAAGGFVYVPPHKFVAFNTGPRTCLGKEMAITQIKVIAIAFLRNYRLQVVDGDRPVAPNLAITLHIKHGLNVRVYKKV